MKLKLKNSNWQIDYYFFISPKTGFEIKIRKINLNLIIINYYFI